MDNAYQTVLLRIIDEVSKAQQTTSALVQTLIGDAHLADSSRQRLEVKVTELATNLKNLQETVDELSDHIYKGNGHSTRLALLENNHALVKKDADQLDERVSKIELTAKSAKTSNTNIDGRSKAMLWIAIVQGVITILGMALAYAFGLPIPPVK